MEYRPWTWKVPENSSQTIKSITRQDANARVSGQAVFTRDIYLPGMLYGKILLSPYAHARIASIDTSKAAALFGVRDILTYADPDIATDNVNGPIFEVSSQYNILTLPGTGDFFQHPMGVAVVADSEEICDQALRLMKIKWEERPFILEMEDALKPDAPKIMPEVKRLNPLASTGVALNYDLAGYHMGTMNDYPSAECLINESHLGYAAYGAYGIGENIGASMSGITVSAIFNATGKWVLDYPTTPDRVLKALGKV